MSDKPETLADIANILRIRAANISDGGAMADGEELRDMADRIEAVAERERDEDRRLAAIAESDEAFARCARCDRPERAPGNAAAMRAALKDVLDHAPFATDHATMLTGGNDLLARLRHAYYAPARNCDRFADVLRASEAYEATKTDLPFEEWLFSTEKGKETDNV